MGTIAEAVDIISNSEDTVALTGAGISQAAGIPTFRDKDGLWQDSSLARWGHREAFDADPIKWFEIFWGLYERRQTLAPSIGHRALKTLVDHYFVSNIITQNVDGFDIETGIPVEKIHELHGQMRTMYCVNCETSVQTPEWLAKHDKAIELPTCSEDGCNLKPDILLFGRDTIPDLEATHEKAFNSLTTADTILVVGASLEIPYVEEWLFDLANGSRNVIIVNPKPTLANPIATLWIPESAETVLPELATILVR